MIKIIICIEFHNIILEKSTKKGKWFLYSLLLLTVSSLYPHCIPTVSSLYPDLPKKNVKTIISNYSNIVNMPYKYKRVCPICQRPWVVNLSSHLEMVHDLNANERADYLKRAILCASNPSVHARGPATTQTAKLKKGRQRHDRRVVQLCQRSSNKTPITDVLPEPYPNFRLRHKFSMMVVGPSMSGKSYFVKELLERDRIEYEDYRKRSKIHWFYGQYQHKFKDMKRSLGHDIYFREGLPTFQLDLCKYNNIIVLDDLMDLAVDSPIFSKLLYCCYRMLFQKVNTTLVSVVALNIWFSLDVRQIDDRSV